MVECHGSFATFHVGEGFRWLVRRQKLTLAWCGRCTRGGESSAVGPQSTHIYSKSPSHTSTSLPRTVAVPHQRSLTTHISPQPQDRHYNADRNRCKGGQSSGPGSKDSQPPGREPRRLAQSLTSLFSHRLELDDSRSPAVLQRILLSY